VTTFLDNPWGRTVMKVAGWLVVCGVVLGVAGPGLAQQGGDQARWLIQQAVAAHGGRDGLAATAGAYVTRGKGAMYPGDGVPRPFTFEYSHQDLTHTRLELHIAFKDGFIPSVRVLNGAAGWEQQGQMRRDLSAAELQQARQGAYESKVRLLYPLLEDPAFTLTPLGESYLGAHQAVGVRVAYPGEPEVRLYFDKSTGLLLKSAAAETLQGRTVVREEYYGNYQEALGRKYPLEATFVLDGKKYLEIKTEEARAVDRIDPAQFTRP
jgi:hypothetical protein